jgi:hypothetical protein
MRPMRSYSEMTAKEKKHSIELWNKFYNSQLRDDFNSSWEYYLERLAYLQQIGIDTSDNGRKVWHQKVTEGK